MKLFLLLFLLLLSTAFWSAAQNIGVNTDGSTPSTLFHTKNTAASQDNYLRIENTQSGFQSALQLLNSGTAGADWVWYIPGGTTEMRLYRGADLATFLANGNVGIGTTAPGEALSVFKAVGGWQGRFSNSNGSGADVYLSHGSGYGMHIRGWNATDGIYTLEMYNNTTLTNAFYNSGRVVLGMAGNVGIGTSSPGAKLHLSAGDGSLALFGPNASWGGKLYVGASPNQAVALTAQVISTDGNLHLDPAPSKNMYLGYYQARDIYINPNGANVGIGNTGPGRKLEVTGDIKLAYGYQVYLGENVSANGKIGINFHTDADPNYWIGKPAGAWTQPLHIGFYTGVKIGANSAYGGTRFFNSSDMATEIMSVGNGDNHVRVGGYLFAQYLNSSDNAVGSGVTGIMVKQGDNYFRTGNAAAVNSFLGITAPTGDNLGNHTATTTLNMANNVINNFSRLDVTSGGNSPNGGYNHYSIYEEPGSWTWPYPDLMIEYHTGIKYIAYYNYGGHRFYAGYTPDASPTTQVFSTGEGDYNTRVNYDLYIGSYGGLSSVPTTYGSLGLLQAKNGYYGVLFGQNTGQPNIMYDGGGNGGIYYENYGWSTYYLAGNRHLMINTSSDLGAELGVNGRIKSNGISETSDIRMKKDIFTIENPIEKVKQIRGVYFNWRTDEFKDKKLDTTNQIGVIAQEVEKILPQVVSSDNEGFKSVEYSKIVAVLIEAIKQQQAIIENQKLNIGTLEKDFKNLKSENIIRDSRILELEEIIGTKAKK